MIILPTGLPGDRWVSAAEIRPSERSVVHHAAAYVREAGDEWLRGKPKGEYFETEGETISTGNCATNWQRRNGCRRARG
jgi:hypothetical protein